MMKFFANVLKKPRGRRGFTLVEAVVVLGVVAVLSGLIVPLVTENKKALDVKQLDDYARTVYLAMQDNLVSLKKTGSLGDLASAPAVPETDNAGFPYEGGLKDGVQEYGYLTSSDPLFDLLLPAGAVEESLRSYNMLAEYNTVTGDMFSVFLSEDPVSYASIGDTARDNDSERKSKELGYYEGELTVSPDRIQPDPQGEDEGTLYVSLALENGEEFLAKVGVPIPAGETALNSYASSLSANMSVKGEKSGQTMEFDFFGVNGVDKTNYTTGASGDRLCYQLSLQSLYRDTDWTGFVPGENVTVSVTVTSSLPDVALNCDDAMKEGNPWFASLTDAGITVTNGRNLQNLRVATADLAEKYAVSTVTVGGDIYWNDTVSYYNRVYGSDPGYASSPILTFSPISGTTATAFAGENLTGSPITTFDGGEKSVYFLNINDSGTTADGTCTGLFRTVYMEVKDLTLVNPIVRGASAANSSTGALAGQVAAIAQLNNCRIQITNAGEIADTGLTENMRKGESSAYSTGLQTWLGVSGKGSVGLLVGSVAEGNKDQNIRPGINDCAISVEGENVSVPASGTSFGLLAGTAGKFSMIRVPVVKGSIRYGSAGVLGGVIGTNNGALMMPTDGSSAQIEITSVCANGAIIGGVAGVNQYGSIGYDSSANGVGRVLAKINLNVNDGKSVTVGAFVGENREAKLQRLRLKENSDITVTGQGNLTVGGFAGKTTGDVQYCVSEKATYTLTGKTVCAGGAAGINGSNLKGSPSEVKPVMTITGDTVYAGGLAGQMTAGEISNMKVQNASLTLAGGVAAADGGSLEKYAGAAVGKDAGQDPAAPCKLTDCTVESTCSLAGWGGTVGTAGNADPSGLGVNVGRFIGYVGSSICTRCTALASADQDYQFLGQIAVSSSTVEGLYKGTPSAGFVPEADTDYLVPLGTYSWSWGNNTLTFAQAASAADNNVYTAALDTCVFLKNDGKQYLQNIQSDGYYFEFEEGDPGISLGEVGYGCFFLWDRSDPQYGNYIMETADGKWLLTWTKDNKLKMVASPGLANLTQEQLIDIRDNHPEYVWKITFKESDITNKQHEKTLTDNWMEQLGGFLFQGWDVSTFRDYYIQNGNGYYLQCKASYDSWDNEYTGTFSLISSKSTMSVLSTEYKDPSKYFLIGNGKYVTTSASSPSVCVSPCMYVNYNGNIGSKVFEDGFIYWYDGGKDDRYGYQSFLDSCTSFSLYRFDTESAEEASDSAYTLAFTSNIISGNQLYQ